MTISKNSLAGLLNTKPQAVTTAETGKVTRKRMDNGFTGITVLESFDAGMELEKWLPDNMALVNKVFNEDRIILFRGFRALSSKSRFAEVVQRITGKELLDYTEPSTPRTRLEGKVYTSTEFPEEAHIPQHNEHSYSDHWPRKVFFYCEQAANAGGQTPVCDSRAVYRLLSEKTVKKFEEKGVMYIRNFGNGIDIPWKDFFQTDNKEEVAAYCRRRKIMLDWKGEDTLTTRQLSQGTLVHPETGEKVWFNQAHLFHYTNLNEEIYQFLIDSYGVDNLPRNACYGDGTPIEAEVLQEIRQVYQQASLSFDWQEGDMVMIDNMLYSHGRAPYSGKRSILVAMTEAYPEELPVNQQTVQDSRRDTATFYINRLDEPQQEDFLKYKLAVANRIMAMEQLEEGGISGHISFKVPGTTDRFWVNPFGLLSEEVTPDNLILVNEDGAVLHGDHPVNVAGFCIHATIHKTYPDVHCIVHTHSPWGTLLSAMDQGIVPVDQNCCMFFENHAIYREYNGPVNEVEDAAKLAAVMAGNNAVILANHGVLTCGESIETAVMYMVAFERAARLNILCRQHGHYKVIADDVARMTREWIANPIGFKIEFDALLRKVERRYPELSRYNPNK